jgi:hypothetical protein
MQKAIKKLAYLILVVGLLPMFSQPGALTAQLAWNPNSEPDLAGYRVYYGEAGSSKTQVLDVGKKTAASISGLKRGKAYFFFLTAYNLRGLESAPSDAITRLIPEGATQLRVSAPSKLEVSAPSSGRAGATLKVTVTARDSSGKALSGYRGKVNFSSSDPQAILPSSYTFQASDNGVRVFSVQLRSAGEHTVRVSEGSISGTSGKILINAAEAAQLLVSAPGSVMVGESFNLTVTARDAFGNVAAGYREKVSVRSTDKQAVLPASYQFTSSDKGSRVFKTALKSEGDQKVTVSDAAMSGTRVITAIDSRPAVELAVSAPSDAEVGKSLKVTVTARDSRGNVVTGYRGKISFSSSDRKAVLPSSYTFKASDKGKRVFSVTFMTPGQRTVSATDSASRSIAGASDPTHVKPAAALGKKPSKASKLRVANRDFLGGGELQVMRLQVLDSLAGAQLVLMNWSGASGQHFIVASSVDLVNWADVPALTAEIAPGIYQSQVFVEPANNRFFRVRQLNQAERVTTYSDK